MMRPTRSSKKIKVESHSNLARDAKTKAILNTDSVEYTRYMNEKKTRQRQQNEIDALRAEIDLLKEMINRNTG